MATEETLIERINKLMALAMDPGATEAERKSAQRFADKLILQNRIDRVKLGAKPDQGGERIINLDMDLYFPDEFRTQVYFTFYWVMQENNVKLHMRGYRQAKLVGYESDVEYAKDVWISVYREFAGNIYPSWDADGTFDDNVYRFVKGGYKWQMIHEEHKKYEPDAKWPSGRYRAAYLRACAARGEEATAHTQRHSAFRLSYAEAFQSMIGRRLREQRARSEKEVVTDHDQYALAVRTNAEKVEEEFYKLFPQYDPEVIRKRNAEWHEAEAARRAAMTPEEREKEDKKRAKEEERDRKLYDKLNSKSYDSNGWQHGTNVAKNVDLSNGRNHITPERKVLP